MRAPEEDLNTEEESSEEDTGILSAQAEKVIDGTKLIINNLKVQEDKLSDITVGFVKKASSALNSFIDIFVGLCFVAMAFFMIVMYHNYGTSVEMLDITDWISMVAMLFGGTVLVFNPRRTFNTSIGLYAIIMGVITFCGNWSGLGDSDSDFSGLLQYLSDAMFIATIVMLGFSVNLMVSGISYLRGRPRGTVGMMMKAAFMMMVNVFMVAVSLRTGEYTSISDAIQKDPVTFVQILMFFIFLNMMDTDEARSFNTKTRLSLSTEALRHTKTVDEKSFVMLTDAEILVRKDFAGWERPDDGGPVDCEYRFPIHGKGGSSYVTVQRWKGYDNYFVTIADHERGTNIRATRMSIDDMALTEDKSVFYLMGTDHFNIRLNVRFPLDDFEVKLTRSSKGAGQ